MRPLALSLLGITCFPAFTQVQTDTGEHRACVVVEKKLLKCLSSLDGPDETERFARTAHVGDIWPGSGKTPIAVTLSATGIRPHAEVTELFGNVEIHTAKLVVLADSAIYHHETGEVEASGNVRVAPVP